MFDIPEVPCIQRDQMGRFIPYPGIIPDLRPSPELSYCLGAIKGDGYIYIAPKFREYKIRLRVTNRKFAQRFFNSLRAIGLNPWFKNIVPQQAGWQPQFGVFACSKSFCLWYRNLTTSALSNFIDHNEENIKQFVAGFFDAEGCIHRGIRKRYYKGYHWNENKHIILFRNTDLDLILLVDGLLQKLGFPFHINTAQARGIRVPCYSLRTAKGDLYNKFLREIPAVKCREVFNG